MTAATVVWGPVADEYGLCHWRIDRLTADGRGAVHEDVYSTEPADDYAESHPAPIPARWCHNDPIGNVVALRRMGGKLVAVAECAELSPDDLEVLTETFGPLRWSASTSKVGRGPLTITECSLTPRPASVGLQPVTWYRAGVSKGNMPGWVREDLKRGRHDLFRRRDSLEVYEAGQVDPRTLRSARGLPSGGEYRHDPREIHYSGGIGYVLSVNGRPPRRD